MIYEEPKVDIVELMQDDIVTLSNGGEFKEDETGDGSWI